MALYWMGKITFWTVNFSESEKKPHGDTTGNEWIYLRPAQYGSRGRFRRLLMVFLTHYEHVNDAFARLRPGFLQLSRL